MFFSAFTLSGSRLKISSAFLAQATFAGVMLAQKINGRETWRTYSQNYFFAAIYPPRLANDLEKVPI